MKSGSSNRNPFELGPTEQEQLLKRIEEDAHDCEVEFGGCAQCTLRSLQIHLGLQNEGALLAASAFAGGFGNCGETCGALSGGFMAISLAYGRGSEAFEKIQKIENWKEGDAFPPIIECIVRGGRFLDRFKERFGSVRCREIRAVVRGRDVNEDFRHPTKETKEKTRQDHHLCGTVTGPAARFAAEIILEPENTFKADILAFLKGS